MTTQAAPSLRIIAGADLGRQAWVDRGEGRWRDPPTANQFLSIEASPSPSVKPRRDGGKAGGLWTSTFDERYGSGWVQWCLDEAYHAATDPCWHTWLLDPEPAARIIVIDSYADLEAVVNAYPQEEHFPDRGYGAWTERRPAWHLIARDFDAVHLTEEGQWDTRLTHPLDLYSWDCESTLWLRWAFAAIEDGGVRTYEARPDDEEGEAT